VLEEKKEAIGFGVISVRSKGTSWCIILWSGTNNLESEPPKKKDPSFTGHNYPLKTAATKCGAFFGTPEGG